MTGIEVNWLRNYSHGGVKVLNKAFQESEMEFRIRPPFFGLDHNG